MRSAITSKWGAAGGAPVIRGNGARLLLVFFGERNRGKTGPRCSRQGRGWPYLRPSPAFLATKAKHAFLAAKAKDTFFSFKGKAYIFSHLTYRLIQPHHSHFLLLFFFIFDVLFSNCATNYMQNELSSKPSFSSLAVLIRIYLQP